MSAIPPAPTLRMLWWLPRLAFLMFVAAVVTLLWFLNKTEQEDQRTTLISDVLWLEQNLRFLLSHNEELLGQFNPQRIDLPAIFDAHARALIASGTGILQIIWLDSAGNLRNALPAPTDTTLVGENQGPIPSPSLTRLAQSVGRAVYSPAYPTVQDDWQFEVQVPIFRGGQIAGTAVGIYSVRRLLEDSVPWWLAERYRISIIDQSGRPLGSRSKAGQISPGSEYQIPFDPPGHGLILQALPYQMPQPLADRKSVV